MAYQVQISAKILNWTKSCPCCSEPANDILPLSISRTTGKQVQRTTTHSWEVPYCKHCLNHMHKFNSGTTWFVVRFIVGILVFFASIAARSVVAGFVLGLLLFIISFIPDYLTRKASQKAACRIMKASCFNPDCAIRYVAMYGTMHTFVFTNKSYLDSFLAANPTKTRSDIKEI